jgi:TP901 family phage tail tape measure protein
MASNAHVRLSLTDGFSGSALAVAAAANKISSSFKSVSKTADTASSRVKKFGEGMSSMGKTLRNRVTLPLTVAGGFMMKTAVDFETSMLRVQSISLATEEDFQRLSESAREMGKNSVFSATEAGMAQTYLAQAGYTVEQNIKALKGVMDLAAASTLGLAEAADIAIGIMGGFAMDTERSVEVADLLSLAAARSNVDVRMLGESFSTVGPEAYSMGLTIQETTAMLGTLGDAAIRGGRAGTALRRAFMNLQNPSTEVAKIFKQVGIKTRDSSGNMRNFIEILQDMKDVGVNDLFITKVFGAVSAGAVRVLTRDLDNVKNLMADYRDNAEGAAEQMARINIGGLSGAMRLLKSAVEETSIELFNYDTLKAIKGIIDKITTGVNKFTTMLTPELKKTFGVVAAIAIGLGPVLLGISTFLMNVTIMSAVVGVAMLPLMAKFVIIAAAVIAIGAAIGFVVSKFSSLKEESKKAGDTMEEAGIKAGKSMSFAGWSVEMLMSICSLLKEIGFLIVNVFVSGLKQLWYYIKTIYYYYDKLVGMIVGSSSTLQTSDAAIGNFFANLPEYTESAAQGVARASDFFTDAPPVKQNAFGIAPFDYRNGGVPPLQKSESEIFINIRDPGNNVDSAKIVAPDSVVRLNRGNILDGVY